MNGGEEKPVNEKKSTFLRRFLILFYAVLTLALTTVLVSSVLSVIRDIQARPLQRQTNKEALFETVRRNADTILEDIEQDDFSRILALFGKWEDQPTVTREGEGVFFDCYGLGFGPSTAYIGFYYAPWDGPAPIPGIMPPWAGYFSAEGEELKQYLEPEENGFAWHEKHIDPGGDNEYYTEKICDHFWYYRLDY